MLYNKKEEEFIISQQKTHHTKQFKLDVINYRKEHPDLTQVECAKNLGNCLRGYLLCQQLSWQNFSFYFVLNLDTGPYYVRSINHTDDNIVNNVAYKTNFKNRNKQQIRYIAQ